MPKQPCCCKCNCCCVCSHPRYPRRRRVRTDNGVDDVDTPDLALNIAQLSNRYKWQARYKTPADPAAAADAAADAAVGLSGFNLDLDSNTDWATAKATNLTNLSMLVKDLNSDNGTDLPTPLTLSTDDWHKTYNKGTDYIAGDYSLNCVDIALLWILATDGFAWTGQSDDTVGKPFQGGVATATAAVAASFGESSSGGAGFPYNPAAPGAGGTGAGMPQDWFSPTSLSVSNGNGGIWQTSSLLVNGRTTTLAAPQTGQPTSSWLEPLPKKDKNGNIQKLTSTQQRLLSVEKATKNANGAWGTTTKYINPLFSATSAMVWSAGGRPGTAPDAPLLPPNGGSIGFKITDNTDKNVYFFTGITSSGSTAGVLQASAYETWVTGNQGTVSRTKPLLRGPFCYALDPTGWNSPLWKTCFYTGKPLLTKTSCPPDGTQAQGTTCSIYKSGNLLPICECAIQAVRQAVFCLAQVGYTFKNTEWQKNLPALTTILYKGTQLNNGKQSSTTCYDPWDFIKTDDTGGGQEIYKCTVELANRQTDKTYSTESLSTLLTNFYQIGNTPEYSTTPNEAASTGTWVSTQDVESRNKIADYRATATTPPSLSAWTGPTPPSF